MLSLEKLGYSSEWVSTSDSETLSLVTSIIESSYNFTSYKSRFYRTFTFDSTNITVDCGSYFSVPSLSSKAGYSFQWKSTSSSEEMSHN